MLTGGESLSSDGHIHGRHHLPVGVRPHRGLLFFTSTHLRAYKRALEHGEERLARRAVVAVRARSERVRAVRIGRGCVQERQRERGGRRRHREVGRARARVREGRGRAQGG